ncbi:MAG TPA: hypothetical protein VGD10_03645 [Allosphingosinicella sp.]|uniref:hypothetical protein n=1 Tax=Allosphingosinicella sp. TaxID=2823234 RepID=UPI002EDA7C23
MTPEEDEELYARIEAEQAVIMNLIDDSRKLSERSDALINSARGKSSAEGEGAGA